MLARLGHQELLDVAGQCLEVCACEVELVRDAPDAADGTARGRAPDQRRSTTIFRKGM
jgi:hypothetical protein